MAYETAITIKEVITNIGDGSYVLPSIQREFVWKTAQIETLFDSLMRDYPIGTFLFWKVDKEIIGDFDFYDFVENYSEKTPHNKKTDMKKATDVTAVLDGQQRMTALYLALVGTYANKKPHARKSNTKSYPARKLYLNLLKPLEEAEKKYDFRFLTKEEAEKPEDGVYWFNCHKILEFEEAVNLVTFLSGEELADTSVYTREQIKFSSATLSKFWNIIHNKAKISFYLEKSPDIDKVLQIFIRTNSGGTKLSYSDLLLSMATAQWKNENENARDLIHKFVDDINNINNIDVGFKFTKDIVLKNSLVLAGFKDIRFKADNFNTKNMKKIEEDWKETSESLRTAIELIESFGYNGKNLIATSAIIPISYFIYKNECENEMLDSPKREADRKAIKEWLARALLKGVFGSQPDETYRIMRDLIDTKGKDFPLQEAIDKGGRKSISFSVPEIDDLLDLQYGQPRTYCALTLIYPALNPNLIFEQDHIHPKSKFKKRLMKDAGFSPEQIDSFNAEVNGIANLQLLGGASNRDKNDTPFEKWLDKTYPNKETRDSYLRENHINLTQSLEFENFLEFIAARKETIKDKLKLALGVTASS